MNRSSAGELRERRLYGNLLSLDNGSIIPCVKGFVKWFLKKSKKIKNRANSDAVFAYSSLERQRSAMRVPT